MGWLEYEPIAAEYRVLIVVTGFEPLDLLDGILRAVCQRETGQAGMENVYACAVTRAGNPVGALPRCPCLSRHGERRHRQVYPL